MSFDFENGPIDEMHRPRAGITNEERPVRRVADNNSNITNTTLVDKRGIYLAGAIPSSPEP